MLSLVGELTRSFEIKKRADGTEYVTTSSELARDMVRDASEYMSLDFAYVAVRNCLYAASDNDLSPRQALDEGILPEADVYTYDLTKWLHDSLKHVGLVNDALEDSGHFDGYSIDVLIMGGQNKAYEYAMQAIADNWPVCPRCGYDLTTDEELGENVCGACVQAERMEEYEPPFHTNAFQGIAVDANTLD
jgi:hypothetical protein